MAKVNNTELSYIDLLSMLHSDVEADNLPYETKQYVLAHIELLETILEKYSA